MWKDLKLSAVIFVLTLVDYDIKFWNNFQDLPIVDSTLEFGMILSVRDNKKKKKFDYYTIKGWNGDW